MGQLSRRRRWYNPLSNGESGGCDLRGHALLLLPFHSVLSTYSCPLNPPHTLYYTPPPADSHPPPPPSCRPYTPSLAECHAPCPPSSSSYPPKTVTPPLPPPTVYYTLAFSRWPPRPHSTPSAYTPPSTNSYTSLSPSSSSLSRYLYAPPHLPFPPTLCPTLPVMRSSKPHFHLILHAAVPVMASTKKHTFPLAPLSPPHPRRARYVP